MSRHHWPMNAETLVYILDEMGQDSAREAIKHLKLGDTFHLFPADHCPGGLASLYFVLDVKRVKRAHMRTKRTTGIMALTQNHEFVEISLRYNDEEVSEISPVQETEGSSTSEVTERTFLVETSSSDLEDVDMIGEDVQ